jgi:hypothetical protein
MEARRTVIIGRAVRARCAVVAGGTLGTSRTVVVRRTLGTSGRSLYAGRSVRAGRSLLRRTLGGEPDDRCTQDARLNRTIVV